MQLVVMQQLGRPGTMVQSAAGSLKYCPRRHPMIPAPANDFSYTPINLKLSTGCNYCEVKNVKCRCIYSIGTVSYTHLTLPTIYSV